MRKIVLIYLLVALAAFPFINAAGASCHSEDKSHICTMYEDMLNHEQDTTHCHDCHINFDFPQIQKLSFGIVALSINVPQKQIILKYFETSNNLYRPPIV